MYHRKDTTSRPKGSTNSNSMSMADGPRTLQNRLNDRTRAHPASFAGFP